MNFNEFANLDRPEEPVLSDEQFRAVLAAARMWCMAEYPKRRRNRRRARPLEQEVDAVSDFDLAELR